MILSFKKECNDVDVGRFVGHVHSSADNIEVSSADEDGVGHQPE